MVDKIDGVIISIYNGWKKEMMLQSDGSVQRGGVPQEYVSPEQGLLKQLRDGLKELKELPDIPYPGGGRNEKGSYLGDQLGFNKRLASFKEDREKFFQKLSGDSYTGVDDMQGLRALVSDYLQLRDKYTMIERGITFALENEKDKAKFQPPLRGDDIVRLQSDDQKTDENVMSLRAFQLLSLCNALKAKKQDARRDVQIDKLHKKITELYASPFCSLQDKQALAQAIEEVKLKDDLTGNSHMLDDSYSSYQTKMLAGVYCDFAVKAKRLECLYAGKDASEVQLREQVSKEVAKEKGSPLTLMQEAFLMPRNSKNNPDLGVGS